MKVLTGPLVSPGIRLPIAGAALTAMLVACGGGSNHPTTGSSGTPSGGSGTPVATTMKCEDLTQVQVAASQIGKPTTGATISSATTVPASDTTGNSEYCKVLGQIQPVDPKAPPINFQVNLPTQWNEKAVHYGGGGFDGTLVTADTNTVQTANSGTPIPTPLKRGYATFGSDSGHSSPGLSGAFAQNEEALLNWGGDSLKKVHDVAHVLMQKRYGKDAKRQYFAGGSQGGHEGFLVIQRFPQDYDGVVSYYPAYDFTGGVTAANNAAKAFFNTPGAALNAGKIALLDNAVFAACDKLDGVEDRLVSNTTACASAFQVATLRCPSGADEGDSCLSDAQINALNVATSRTTWNFPLSGGTTSATGSPSFYGAGSELSVWVFGLAGSVGLGDLTFHNSILGTFADQYIKYFITKDPTYDSANFDPKQWPSQMQDASRKIDASSVEIAPFQAKGGKLLLMHGSIDHLVNTGFSVDYYNRLVARYGQGFVDSFAKFYVIPGLGHSIGPFLASWDSLGALDSWVESNAAPTNNVVYDANPGTTWGRSRPLCAYPSWPKYNGSGDINSAASFSCATQ